MTDDRQKPARQLALGLPHRAALGRADFLVGDANRAAVTLIDHWPLWPEAGVFLAGPAGSGKSHLVEIWRRASEAVVLAAGTLDKGAAEVAGNASAVAVEDLHAGDLDEAALFHLLNLARERRTAVLLTSRLAPAALAVRLLDLASRLRAMHPAALAAPDDDLLRVLVKLFADRQLAVEAAVIDFLVLRMERSLEAANALVAHLDEEALAAGRPITRRLAAEALAAMPGGQAELWPEDEAGNAGS
jgi:chromosomal replication initiation ATPase DnaA